MYNENKICKICGLPEAIHRGMKHINEGEGAVALVSKNIPLNPYKGDWGFKEE